ncbi:YaiO family outer membrane beta-barrel protein [Geomonas sp. RF6]|uniref:YaiO family outer membrane beta-barrel protein n=1 Tax=Geomonas sp. RF6 TaxID=2897342 RepID=UPI001E4D4B7A|nr:YaiO family outer membrane beta-barrel protein [Geomonas sp. RF6]UFS70771.1 YaiO family outer membrane beta-barrel protein [Geomonas sp. RF6]
MKKLALTLAFLAPLLLPGHDATAAAPAQDEYSDGIRRVQKAAADGEFQRAELVLSRLMARYGENAELLTIRGRLLFWQKRYADSLQALQRARQLKGDREIDAEIARVERAQRLAEADQLVAHGELMRAGAHLAPLYESGRDRYEPGMRLAAVRNRQGRHREAAQVYQTLMRDYPKDTELPLLYAGALANSGDKEGALQVIDALAKDGKDPRPFALRGRIFSRQGRYFEAREEFEKAKALGGTPELPEERKALEEAIKFQHVKSLVAAGGYDLAEPLLKSMSAPGPYAREARLLSGRVMLAQGRYPEALSQTAALNEEYPADPEVAALYAEALINNGRRADADRVLSSVSGSAEERLRNEREDLFYRAKGDWLRLAGDVYHYSNGSDNESGVALSVSHRFPDSVAVASVSGITRFGRTDPQLALDIYFPRFAKKLSGAVYLTAAPGSSFLPRYSAGGEVSWAFPSVEVSAGYNHLGFHGNAADVLSAAATWYVPSSPVSITEKVYFTPKEETSLWLTTVRWDPDHRFGAFLSAGVGNSSERRVSSEDVQRYDTWLVRAGGEYRFSPRYSIGGEGSFESRRNLYDRAGGVLYLRYWWS